MNKPLNSCDLHVHSHFSDGTFSPKQIVRMAKQLNIAVALTDHNTVLGLEQFDLEAKKQGVEGVCGVELSTVYKDKEFHLLGLFIKPEHYDKVELLVQEFKRLKQISNKELIENLNRAGYKIDYNQVISRNATGVVNRAHIGAELVEKGYFSSRSEAFNSVLDESKGFYIPPKRLNLLDAIKFLNEINALPILAHPLKDASEQFLDEMLPIAKKAGLVGIEVYHSSYSASQSQTALNLAKAYDFKISGGSDFHGENKPDVLLGRGKNDNAVVDISVYYNLLKLSLATTRD
ncbi:MAG: PHP domain-containing protein [Clostridia bacterium]|nr:PHP domain-containing protein [Clostridia bacterium]